MIYAKPAQSFDATLQGAPTGLVGTLGVRIIDQPAGTLMLARTTSGISEQPVGSGIYSTALTAPAVNGTYLVVWDTGGLAPVFASEELQVAGVVPADVIPAPAGPGANVVSLIGYVPPPRYPPADQPWTKVRIDESADGDDPWMVIEPAFTLDPPADDPAAPPDYNFTTASATLPNGWYRVVWIDDAGHERATGAIHNGEATDAQIRPTLDEVANLVAPYTTSMGNELGTFTADTRPTATEVNALIDVAVSDLRSRVDAPIPDDRAEEARHLVALQTATLIQTSRFAENLDTDRSAYNQYSQMYLQAVEALRRELAPIPIV